MCEVPSSLSSFLNIAPLPLTFILYLPVLALAVKLCCQSYMCIVPSFLSPANYPYLSFESSLRMTPLLTFDADSLATLALFLPFLFLPDLAKSSGIEAEKVKLFK